MKRKGISPLIAAVLLIAFTMAVASLFAQWAPQLIQNAQGETLNRSQNIQECSKFGIEIREPEIDSVTIKQVRGDDGVKNISVTWYYNNSLGPVQKYANIENAAGLDTANVEAGDLDGVNSWPDNHEDNTSIDYMEAQSLSCDEVATQYPPGQT